MLLLPRPGARLRPGIGRAGSNGRQGYEAARAARRAGAALSLRYLQAVPSFSEHFYDSEDEGDESVDNGPTGGLTWDGRVDHGADQAKIPLLSPFEMGNKDAADVAAKLRKAPYAGDIRAAFGETVFDNPDDTFDAAAEALATFEQSGPDFYPYSSRYDAFLAGKTTLSAQELHGRQLFEDPAKGQLFELSLKRTRQ
ncbi:UNVERIFIED_ORG: cytochrome c peroxidase [Rhizobium etli]